MTAERMAKVLVYMLSAMVLLSSYSIVVAFVILSYFELLNFAETVFNVLDCFPFHETRDIART